MKRSFSLVIPFLLLSGLAGAQNTRWVLGSGITYCSYLSNPGVNVNVTYRIAENLHIGPDFSAILNNKVTRQGQTVIHKELEYNVNAHNLFDLSGQLAIYPLFGVNYSKVTIHPDGEEKEERWVTALNAGGGIEILLPGCRLFFEAKYVTGLSKYDLTAGVLVDLGKNPDK